MKKIVFFLLAAFLLLTGCQSQAPAETTETTMSKVDLSSYVCHWESVPQADGKLHYYFMSANGLLINPEATYPEKWGDCCLLILPDGTTVLIDSGNRPFAPVLSENLRKMGVERLDYVILTHPHRDHFGGLVAEDGVIHTIPIGKILTSGIDIGEDVYTEPPEIEKLCREKSIPVEVLKMGDVLELGEVTLRVLWPQPELIGTALSDTEEVNNASLVLRLDYKEHSALFTGDVYASAEGDLLTYGENWALLKVDLLKVPHHGGKTSSSMDFILAVDAQVAVATGYTPMTAAVTFVYDLASTQLLADQDHGCIHIATDGVTMEAESQRSGPVALS